VLKKFVSMCFAFIILVALVYTIFTNFYSKDKRQLEVVFDEEASTILNEEDGQDSFVNEEGGLVEYRTIEEEPEMYESHEEDGHDHGEEMETEVRALNIKAPNFELKTLSGDTVRLSDYKGKKVFINFWATWCPPCVEEMPTIQRFYEEYGTKEDIVILAINATDLETSIDKVKTFTHEYGISFPVLLDEKGKVSIDYEILTIPTSMIVDENGMSVEQIIGPVTEEMLISKLISQ